MKMEGLSTRWLLLVTVAICWLSVDADSSDESSARYRGGNNVANIQGGRYITNSISGEDSVFFVRRRRCERIKHVCASNNMIYYNYCDFKEARWSEYISRVECTTGHMWTYDVTTRPPRVTNRPRPKTTQPEPPEPIPEGENGRINGGTRVVPIPELPTTKSAVDLTTKTPENCTEVCPLIFEPVCGTDGITYPNTCVIEASKCTGNTDKSVTIDYYGECGTVTAPIGNLDVTPSYRYCPEDVCEETINYVCGTDGNTYDNKCELLKIACAGGNSSSLDIEYEGQCIPLNVTVSPEGESDKTMEPLPTPKKSQMTTVDPCVNPTCKVVWEPVCADDGKTYPSRCVLENINRCSELTLTLLYDGECVESTTAFKCTTCTPLHLEPVCGTDNASYTSRCILEKYNCENNLEIEVAYEGECIRGDV